MMMVKLGQKQVNRWFDVRDGKLAKRAVRLSVSQGVVLNSI